MKTTKLYSKEKISGNFKYVYQPLVMYYTNKVGFGQSKKEAYEDFIKNNRTIYINTPLPDNNTEVYYKDYFTKLEDIEVIYVKGFYWQTDKKGKLINTI